MLLMHNTVNRGASRKSCPFLCGQYLIESKWTICKNCKDLVARSTTFKKTSNFLHKYYSRNLAPHLLQVVTLSHKQALSLSQLGI